MKKLEALDLLRGWRDERQEIFYAVDLPSGHILAQGRGRLGTVSEGSVQILTSPDRSEEYAFLDFPLPPECAYRYQEGRENVDHFGFRFGQDSQYIGIVTSNMRLVLSAP